MDQHSATTATGTRYRVLRQASFDPKLPTYYLLSGVIVLSIFIVTIPLAVVYYLVGRAIIDKYIERLGCTLTERTLEIRKGLFNRVESTVPLDKITDLQMVQGPIMRHFGLHGFKVETAGQSSGPAGHLVSMVGIVDAPGFRQAVLDQRDAMADGRGSVPQAQPERLLASEDAAAVLVQIRDTLKRIEGKIGQHRVDL